MIEYQPHMVSAPKGADPSLQPHSESAEQAVIGSILLNPDALYEVKTFLKPGHFFFLSHRWIYEAILIIESRQDAIDLLTVADELRKRNQLQQVGGEAYLTSLASNTPSFAHVATYGHLVERGAIRRQLLSAANGIAKAALSEELPLDEVLSFVKLAVNSVQLEQRSDDLQHVQNVLPEVIEYVDRMARGGGSLGRVGYAAIDNLLQGIDPGTTYCVAARPGAGKTAFMCNLAMNLVEQGRTVAYFSIEMSGRQTLNRMLSMKAGVNGRLLRNGTLDTDQYGQLINSIMSMENLPLYIDSNPRLTVPNLQAKLMKMQMNGVNIDDVIIDYISLMKDARNGQDERSRVKNISNDLRDLARTTGVRICFAAQLNRAVENRSDPCPNLSDLKESGDIEQDCAAVLFLYRDREDVGSPFKPVVPLHVYVAKNRFDTTGKCDLLWNLPTQLMLDMPARNSATISDMASIAAMKQRI